METNKILPQEAIDEFKKIYKRKFKKDLSDEEATYRANNLFHLYKAVYEPSISQKTGCVTR